MKSMKLMCEGNLSVTGISNIFLDDFMPQANGEFVKVYLYLLRCLGDASKDCSLSAIADQLNHTENDVARALAYWERQNILELSFDANNQIDGIKLCALGTAPVAPATAAPQTTISVQPVASVRTPAVAAYENLSVPVVEETPRREYSPDEIDAFRANPDVSEILYVAEAYLQKPPTYTEINTILVWYDELKMSAELIEYLIEYCIGKGHSSFRYMDKIAMDWCSRQISSVEDAKADAANHNKTTYSIIKAMGISGRDLAQSERAFIERWTNEWRFELPLILEACRRTIDVTHQPSFAYADKILDTWKKSSVHTMNDILKLDQQYTEKRKISVKTVEPNKRTKFSNFDGRNNDYDQLENLLVNNTAQ